MIMTTKTTTATYAIYDPARNRYLCYTDDGAVRWEPWPLDTFARAEAERIIARYRRRLVIRLCR